MVIYDSSNKTLRYYNGTQWSTMISSQTLTTANEGVVKMNSVQEQNLRLLLEHQEELL
jgi:hypothetical protein